MSLMVIFSTSHRQRGVRLLFLVAGDVLFFFFFLFFFSFFFSIYGVLCGNYN